MSEKIDSSSKAVGFRIVHKNFATKFFKETGVDCSNIDVTKPYQVTELIKKNIEQISKTLYNDINNGKNIFAGQNDNTLQAVLGFEGMRLINQKHHELKQNIKEVCETIRIQEFNPQEVFDIIGITYHHGNLPSECDGLF
jgi:hypothetical protein